MSYCHFSSSDLTKDILGDLTCVIKIMLFSKLTVLFSWFAYNVIKSMIMQIMTNLPQILVWPIRPQNVSLYRISSYLKQ